MGSKAYGKGLWGQILKYKKLIIQDPVVSRKKLITQDLTLLLPFTGRLMGDPVVIVANHASNCVGIVFFGTFGVDV